MKRFTENHGEDTEKHGRFYFSVALSAYLIFLCEIFLIEIKWYYPENQGVDTEKHGGFISLWLSVHLWISSMKYFLIEMKRYTENIVRNRLHVVIGNYIDTFNILMLMT